jgi:arginine/serine-rich splicing factor 4/5/6
MEDEINNQNGHDAPMDNDDDVQGSAALRPIFLGNLNQNFTSEDVMEIFERPIQPAGQNYKPFPVDRVDLKRGYCFVFLKDAVTQEDKEAAERFVVDINGMYVHKLRSS